MTESAFDSSHFMSVSLVKENPTELRENIKYKTQNPSLGIGMNMENSLAIVMRI